MLEREWWWGGAFWFLILSLSIQSRNIRYYPCPPVDNFVIGHQVVRYLSFLYTPTKLFLPELRAYVGLYYQTLELVSFSEQRLNVSVVGFCSTVASAGFLYRLLVYNASIFLMFSGVNLVSDCRSKYGCSLCFIFIFILFISWAICLKLYFFIYFSYVYNSIFFSVIVTDVAR